MKIELHVTLLEERYQPIARKPDVGEESDFDIDRPAARRVDL